MMPSSPVAGSVVISPNLQLKKEKKKQKGEESEKKRNKKEEDHTFVIVRSVSLSLLITV